MTAKYIFEEPWNFKFSLAYPKSDAFEAAMTTCEGNEMFTKLNDGILEDSIYSFPVTAVRTVSSVLKHIGVDIDVSDLMTSIGKPKFEDLGQLYLRDEQFKFINKIMGYWSGSITLEMGFGKGTMITYLCKVSLFREKKIVICAPTYSIVEELKLRLDRYNINSSMNFDPTANIWVINPVGFMARNSKDEAKEWFKEVDLLIVDEADGVTDSLEHLVTDFLPNCRYFYGFSATPDRKTGQRFDSITSLSKFTYTAARILIYFGPSIVYRPPSKKVRVVLTPINTGNYKNLWSYDKCVCHVTHSFKMPYYLRECIKDNNRFARSTILVPFTNKAQIEHFMDSPVLKPYHLIIWTASGIVHNDGTEEKGAGLERVKELVNNHQVDMMFCTSIAFKGVDITELKSVLFFTCSSYGIVTQILGRIFRYNGPELPTVYLMDNISENPLYNKAQKSRKEFILNNEHTTEIMRLPFLPK